MILDPIFNPLLSIKPAYAILIISIIVSLTMTLIYKFMTDQNVMKSLKGRIKDLQKQMKDNKSDTQKVMSLQKESLNLNMKYMSQSMKPTLVTFIPIILIIGWLNANLAFQPLLPNEPFQVNVETYNPTNISLETNENLKIINQSITGNIITYTLKAPENTYILKFNTNNETITKKIIVTKDQKYEEMVKKPDSNNIKSIKVENKPMKPFGNFSIFGWNPGWLGTYIIFTLIINGSLRKALKLQ